MPWRVVVFALDFGILVVDLLPGEDGLAQCVVPVVIRDMGLLAQGQAHRRGGPGTS